MFIDFVISQELRLCSLIYVIIKKINLKSGQICRSDFIRAGKAKFKSKTNFIIYILQSAKAFISFK